MRDGHFSPAGIDGSYACLYYSLPIQHITVPWVHTRERTLDTLLVYRHTHNPITNTDRGHSNLTNTRGV